MQPLPYLSSQTDDELVKGLVRLQQVTHEPWMVDWEKFALVCRHGMLIPLWSVLANPIAALRGHASDRS